MKGIYKLAVIVIALAAIVLISGCSTPNQPAPTPTPAVTPVTQTPTPTPVETPATITNTTNTSNSTVVTTVTTNTVNTSTVVTPNPVQNGTHISITQKNLEKIRASQGVVNNESGATIVAIPTETTPYTSIVPTNANKATNPFNTTGNNAQVTPSTGTLTIEPATTNTSSSGSIYVQNGVHISTSQCNAQ